MSEAITDELQFHVWTPRDVAGDPITGLQATMTATLLRFTASAQAAASESVTIAEIGATGHYVISYTPEESETYTCRVYESTEFIEFIFEDEVMAAATSVAVSNSYCTEADVVAFAQTASDYTASTKPTETQVLLFMELRASEIRTWMSEVLPNSSVPGPTGWSTTIDNSTDKGKALERLTRMANALGAAMDALEAAGAGEAPAKSERVIELGIAYALLKPEVQQAAMAYDGGSSLAANHISTGEITAPAIVNRTGQGFQFTDQTEW